MKWIKQKIQWITGAIAALVFFYWLGRRDGKNAETKKTSDKAIKWCAVAKRIDDLSDDTISRMHSKYD